MKIILIGPMGVGKTTIGKILSKHYHIPYHDFDRLRWKAFKKMDGYSKRVERKIAKNSPPEELFKYWKPFEAKQVVTMIEQNDAGVFDFGAGHSVYEDKELFNKVNEVLKDEPFVFYLRYDENKKESIEILSSRDEIPSKMKAFYKRLNAYFINSKCNDVLSKYRVDRKNKNIKEVVNEITDTIDSIKKDI